MRREWLAHEVIISSLLSLLCVQKFTRTPVDGLLMLCGASFCDTRAMQGATAVAGLNAS